jgi:hypothetical protein
MRDFYSFGFGILFICFYTVSHAQSDEYMIESFQGEYIELTEYESAGILALGNPLWELEFEFGFEFPFYGELYERMIWNAEAWGMLTDDEDEAFFMMNFTRGYAFEPLEDTIDIESDARFAQVVSNGMKAFVLQYTEYGFFADPFEDSIDVDMNFQFWFYENGVIEVHFGDMDMDGSPIYRPGKGFYCYSSGTGLDTNEVCGPHMGIENPYDEEDGIALKGSYDDFEVTGQIYDVMTDLPPKGWIIRFLPKSVGIFEPDYRITEFSINPNPAISYLEIPKPGSYITIYDMSGKVRFEGMVTDQKFSVTEFPTGMYILKIASGGEFSIGRFIKS